MERVVYLDGEFVPERAASVSVFDHGVLYGDGIFEGIRAYTGRVFRLERHIDRLFASARAIALDLPHTPADFAALVVECCRRNAIVDGYIRLVVTRGRGELGINPTTCTSGPTIFIIARPAIALYTRPVDAGIRAVTATCRRMPPDALNPSIKTLNYLNNIMARLEANQRGADEALMLDAQGYVAEATADNVFVCRAGGLMTPWTSTNLAGVTREAVMELARADGIDVLERPFTQFDVWTADEVFLTGTGAEIVPVVEVDGRRIGDGTPGPITRRIVAAFHALVRSTGTPIGAEGAAVLSGGLRGSTPC